MSAFVQMPGDRNDEIAAPSIDETLFRPLRECPMCGAAGARVIRRETNHFAVNDAAEREFFAPYEVTVDLRQCGECSFTFIDRLPVSGEFYRRLYSLNRYDYDFEFAHHGKRAIYADLKKRVLRYQPGGRLLDIGAWCGTLLAELADAYQVVGCELSEPAAAYARGNGFEIHCAPFQEAGFGPESFDAVTIIDVLEHLTDPRAVLRKIGDLLRPGGIVYIKVPNVAGQIKKQNLLRTLRLSQEGVCTNFVHINHFGHRSLARGLTAMGFEVLEQGFTKADVWDLRVPRPFSDRSKKRAVNLARRVGTSATSLISRFTSFNVGLNIYTIARKTGEGPVN